jgi:peptidoglycan/xylan/chitin deacetylase (PgdA/CDA1 family)
MTSSLDRELEDLRDAAGAHAAQHRFIPEFHYPPGVRIAVNFTLDFDSMLLRRLLNEPPMQLAKGEFGGRVGIWRLIELFDSHRVTATIFTPGRACELYPQALRAAVRSSHEIADHMWEHRVPKEAELEEDHLSKTVAAIEKISGRRPLGTRSSHSAALLRKYGYIYRSEGSADQRPHYELDENGENCLINLPFHYVIDDAMFSASPGSAARTRRSALPTPNASSTSGGRPSASNTGRAVTSISACTLSSPAGRCGWRCWTG